MGIRENALKREPNASTDIYHSPYPHTSKIPIPSLPEPATCHVLNLQPKIHKIKKEKKKKILENEDTLEKQLAEDC